MSARRKAELVLTEAERAQLVRWARRAKTAQYLALRAKIVLRCAEGGTNKQAAAGLGVDESTARPAPTSAPAHSSCPSSPSSETTPAATARRSGPRCSTGSSAVRYSCKSLG
jgi:hypothetical protein